MRQEQQHAEEHGSLIKTPKQLIVTVVLAFLVPIIVILLLVNLVASGTRVGAGSDTLTAEATARRIAPVAGFELVDANAPRVLQTGEQVYNATCASCHGAGVAGAPKLGDEQGWAKYIKEGYETMLKVAIEGKGAMPPKGGNPALDDLEVARAVVYMANQSGANLEEPAEPAPQAQQDGAQPEGQDQAPAGTGAASAPAQQAAQPQQAQQQGQPQPGQPEQAPQGQQAEPAQAAAAGQKPAAGEAQAAIDPAGEKLYKTTCFACHGTGVGGAPKLGDKAAWDKYIETGEDAMLAVVIKGKGIMPPKGGAANASEDELRAAIRYMVNSVK
ncbi:c-type cytochrome [Orrella sp. JC864]|uniref:c-type cytochrome n=1 Tax=Orrella sp. JC864 TaxID=3120298 RepID=UPI00300B1111